MIVNEIFTSIDGEINHWHQGRISTFIRLAGCNLRCSYCDTKYAQEKNAGKEISIKEIIAKVKKIGLKNITITGGEPFFQSEVKELIWELIPLGCFVSIETNGSYFLAGLNLPLGNFSIVMDYKLFSSGETEKMKLKNFNSLSETDIIKFVISNKEDYFQAKQMMKIFCRKTLVNTYAFSSCFGKLEHRILMEWMIKDKIKAALNVPLHKLLNLK